MLCMRSKVIKENVLQGWGKEVTENNIPIGRLIRNNIVIGQDEDEKVLGTYNDGKIISTPLSGVPYKYVIALKSDLDTDTDSVSHRTVLAVDTNPKVNIKRINETLEEKTFLYTPPSKKLQLLTKDNIKQYCSYCFRILLGKSKLGKKY